MPVYSKNGAGVTETAIGLIFFANTVFIVLFQFPIAKALEGRRHMPAFALMGVIWALSVGWPVRSSRAGPLIASALAVGRRGLTVFAVGECLHGTVQGPLVADLAEPAWSAATWPSRACPGSSASFSARRSAAPSSTQPPGRAVVSAPSSGAGRSIWSLRLDRTLPDAVRRTPGRPIPPPTPTPAEALATRPSG